MEFKSTTIAPAGRNKYGNYTSPGNITKKVTMTTYAGNNTTTTISDEPSGTDDEEPELVGFYCVLTNTSRVFDMAVLEQHDDSDSTTVIAYRGTTKINAYICDMDSVEAVYDSDGNLINLIVPENMGITGIPSGMSVSISNNGTSTATITFTANRSIVGNSGVINIPVTVYNRRADAQPSGDHVSNWYQNNDYCEIIWLTYSWSVNRSSIGRTGAAIRGPYAWEEYSGVTRCWCSGNESTGCPDCEKWIDVIVKDGVYYYCNTTYEGTLSPWASVEENWTEGESFDFVATNLLLASGASINFLTNNELYLRDSNNVVTAGAKGGDGINFWAGASSADTALWYVSNDGTMTAKKGTFGSFEIGTEAGFELTGMYSSGQTSDEGDYYYNRTSIAPNGSYFIARSSSSTVIDKDVIAIIPKGTTALYDSLDLFASNKAPLVVVKGSVQTIDGDGIKGWNEGYGISTNANVGAFDYLKKVRHGIKARETYYGAYGYGTVPACDMARGGVFPGLEIQFRTTNAANFSSAGTWVINGVDTGISHKEPRSLFYQNSLGGWYFDGTLLANFGINIPQRATYTFSESSTKYWHFKNTNLGVNASTYDTILIMESTHSFADKCYVGYWFAVNSSYSWDAVYLGIGSSPAYGMVMRNNTIYIEL